MYSRLKLLCEQNKIDEEGLQKAVEKNWITQEQKNGIMSGVQNG